MAASGRAGRGSGTRLSTRETVCPARRRMGWGATSASSLRKKRAPLPKPRFEDQVRLSHGWASTMRP
jgi:hypothetical protein